LLEILLILDPSGIVGKDNPQLDKDDPQSDLRLQEMMAIKPDALPSALDKEWVFEFDFNMKGEVNSGLLDTDMVTLTASVETLKVRKPKRHQGSKLEEHELGPEPKHNPGPPFAVGDIILCNIRGTAGLQRAVRALGRPPQVSALPGGRETRWNSYRGGLAFTSMGIG
jgi:hypothetical protein